MEFSETYWNIQDHWKFRITLASGKHWSSREHIGTFKDLEHSGNTLESTWNLPEITTGITTGVATGIATGIATEVSTETNPTQTFSVIFASADRAGKPGLSSKLILNQSRRILTLQYCLKTTNYFHHLRWILLQRRIPGTYSSEVWSARSAPRVSCRLKPDKIKSCMDSNVHVTCPSV